MWIMRRKGCLTAKKLARLIGCKCKKHTLPRRREFIVNYGNNYNLANLNSRVSFNKYNQLQKLKLAGVNVPKFFSKSDSILDSDFPLLARKYYHSQGRDIIYINNRRELINLPSHKYDFLTRYIDKKSEYRVHVLGNDITMVSVKWSPSEETNKIIRAKRFGWKQIEYHGQHKETLINIAKNTIRSLGWDFGAIDIIRKGEEFWVLEANSSAGLEDRKLQVYANWLKQKELEWKRKLL